MHWLQVQLAVPGPRGLVGQAEQPALALPSYSYTSFRVSSGKYNAAGGADGRNGDALRSDDGDGYAGRPPVH